jgi:hypothetical protein
MHPASPWRARRIGRVAQGDPVATSSERGWISLFAVERAGPTMRLVRRATFDASADRPYSYAFRSDGGLATITDD